MSKSTDKNGLIEDFYWRQVELIGIGKRYHRPDPERIKAKKEIDAYLDDWLYQRGQGLFITGPVGTGKSTSLAYLTYHITRKIGYRFVPSEPYATEYWESDAPRKIGYASTAWLFNAFRNFDDHQSRQRAYFLSGREILILDDLGREYRSPSAVSAFEEFIEDRYAKCLATIVVSNLDPETLKGMPDFSRIVDRFKDPRWMKLIMVTGKSMRR